MSKNYINQSTYLTGITPEMPEVFWHLNKIFKYQAFELYKDKESDDYFIPYMMNDALEYYLVLKEVHMTGNYLPDKKILSAQAVRNGERYVLIIRQEDGNICTLHFQEIEERAQCYQYHRIGHFWVKGQEQWRQLVYMIGTIYDKYEYFGERFCNEQELQILHLIQFAPFRQWSPMNETLEDSYPNAYEGLAVMEQLVLEAGDKSYHKLLWLYQKFPFRYVADLLGRHLLSSKRQKLYNLICEKVEMASMEYPERDYGVLRNSKIRGAREKVEENLLRKGYAGNYPVFRKGDVQILAMEEHPFTVMESEDFVFRIRLMVSEYRKSVGDAGEKDFGDRLKIERNAGFFSGKGRRGWIVDAEAFQLEKQ